MSTLPCLLFSFALVTCATAFSYHLGKCPKMAPMQKFNMTQFLGPWYVIQETSTSTTCLTYTYTENALEKGQYLLEEWGVNWMGRRTSSIREITIMNTQIPATMTVDFAIGTAIQNVIMTDYNRYAGIFTCQNMAFAHRMSAAILSRKPTLDKKYVVDIQNQFRSYAVDINDLRKISHKACNGDGYY